MKVMVNGEARLVPDGALVQVVLDSLGAPSVGTAVAVNGEVVPRRDWPRRRLTENDQVEVLTAVQGG